MTQQEQRPRDSAKTEPDLFYRKIPHMDAVVFASPTQAYEVHTIRSALEQAKTWGELEILMPPGEVEDILTRADDDVDEVRPEPEDSFSAEQVPGFSDGDYPFWLQQTMDNVLPADILERYATLTATVLNGDFWHIDTEYADAIVEELQQRGITVAERPDLDFF